MAEVVDTAPLSFHIDPGADHPTVILHGIGSSDQAAVTKAVCGLAEDAPGCVPVDMGLVDGIEPDLLASLVDSAAAVKSRAKRVRLVNLCPAAHSLLDKLQLTHVFCLEAACRSDCSGHPCPFASKTWEADLFELPSHLRSCREARDRVARLADTLGFGTEQRDDVLLAVGETTSNAIKHGRSNGQDSRFTVSCVATQHEMRVSVSDSGPGFNPSDIPDPAEGVLLEKGRGVHCTNAVMDEVDFRFGGGTTVRMVKYAAR